MRPLTLLLFFAIGCTTATPGDGGSGAAQPLRAALSSDGGFSGRGVGSVTVDGSNATTTDIQRRSCSAPLTGEERKSLEAALRAAKPSAWQESYANPKQPYGHPDQVRFTLTAAGRSVSFLEDPDLKLPDDLASLRDVLSGIRKRVQQCSASS